MYEGYGFAPAPMPMPVPAQHKKRGMSSLDKGTYSSGGEVVDWTYYDQFVVTNGVNIIRTFTQGIGQGSTPKTLDYTNMTLGGQIPNRQRMTIHALKMHYTTSAARGTATVQYLYSLLNQTTLEFMITGKDSLLTTTLQELMGACTLFALTPTNSGDNIPLIMPRYVGQLRLRIPIVLSAQTPFEVRVTHQTTPNVALNGDLIRLGLHGKLERNS